MEDVDDTVTKENQHFSSTPVKQSDMYLQRSAQKSRQCLSSIGSFYGSAPPKSFHSNTPSMPSQWLNSKRGPGLMPDPTPNKRPRLSDGVPYSMKAKSTLPSDQKQQPALQGFSNLGNTCYMNAILQSLFGLDTLTTDLLTTNHRMLKTLSPQSLYSALVKLLFSRRQNASEISRRDYLRRVKTTISTTAKRFSGYGQHDAHEFLGQVLDQLKEEVIAINKSTPSPPRDTTNDSEFVNPTSRNFEFEVLHTISCEHCREEVTNTEQFLDVSVDLPKRKDALTPRSLQDALSIFFREENIEYMCEKCGHNKSNVTHKFARLPRVFILHLKRYSYNQMFSRNTKMGQNVSIPLYLTLDSHCGEGTQPAFPAPLHDVCTSDQKSVHPLDDSREDMGSRRKLNYPRFNFKKTASVATSGADSVVITDVTNSNTDADDFKKVDGDTRAPTLEDESEDTELTRAIEMSLKEQEQHDQMVRDYGDDSANSFQRVLEMSRTNGAPDTADVKKDLDSLTEEQRIQIAIEESLREIDPYHHGNYNKTDDVTQSRAQDYSGHNGVLEIKEHNELTANDIGPDQTESCSANKDNFDSRVGTNEIIKCCSDVVMSFNSVTSSDNVVMSPSNAVPSSNNAVMSPGHAVMSSDNVVISPVSVVKSSNNAVMSPSHAVMSSDDALNSSQGSSHADAVRSNETEQLTKIEDKNRLPNSARKSFSERLSNAKFSSDEDEVYSISDSDIKQPTDACSKLSRDTKQPTDACSKLSGDSDTKQPTDACSKLSGDSNTSKCPVSAGCDSSSKCEPDCPTITEPAECDISSGATHPVTSSQRKCQLTSATVAEGDSASGATSSRDDGGTDSLMNGGTVVQEFPQFGCNEDDSWIYSIDEKENTLPVQPVLSDPGDGFSATPGLGADEVDGFIEENLDIPEIRNEKGELPYSYRLVSVVNHMGVSSSTGHYISDVYDIKKRTWNSFDDAHVTKISETDVRSTRERTGYIFFYISKDLFDDLCLHHSIKTTKVSDKIS